ncbi:hypothetical protein EVAR_27176_1 [Eumeta japonica]|uniref:Uncharacterized protein n=1 Tax=Eumeta variegata TaxID=151549 RepID=A0A4C1W1L5_EUMVA|nr:hypothetical protein EVAR_27176_1 [Eumeta japonica]
MPFPCVNVRERRRPSGAGRCLGTSTVRRSCLDNERIVRWVFELSQIESLVLCFEEKHQGPKLVLNNCRRDLTSERAYQNTRIPTSAPYIHHSILLAFTTIENHSRTDDTPERTSLLRQRIDRRGAFCSGHEFIL